MRTLAFCRDASVVVKGIEADLALFHVTDVILQLAHLTLQCLKKGLAIATGFVSAKYLIHELHKTFVNICYNF